MDTASLARTRPLKLLFSGGFREDAGKGIMGGMVVACRLLMASPFGEQVSAILVDSSTRTPPPALPFRALRAAGRTAHVFLEILFRRPDCALIFATSGQSWIEKGVTARLCHSFGIPVILSPRNISVAEEIARSPWRQRFTDWVFKGCTRVMLQSREIQLAFGRLIPSAADKMIVVGNWMDFSKFGSVGEAVDDGLVRVVFVGRITRAKGLDILVDAVARHRVRFAGIRFLIYGEGPELANLRAAVSRAGVQDLFSFEGWISGDQKVEAFARSTLVVLPSRYEGMPNVLLEAMAAGRPVVATAVGGVPDLIATPDRGSLVPPGDADALAEAILEMARDPERRRAIAREARAYTMEHHNISTAWRKVYALVQEAARMRDAKPSVGQVEQR